MQTVFPYRRPGLRERPFLACTHASDGGLHLSGRTVKHGCGQLRFRGLRLTVDAGGGEPRCHLSREGQRRDAASRR